MTTNIYTYFEIREGNGTVGKHGQYSFDTAEKAKEIAVEFKNNPRSHNEKMTDENVAYWQSKTYTIVRKIIITDEGEQI